MIRISLSALVAALAACAPSPIETTAAPGPTATRACTAPETPVCCRKQKAEPMSASCVASAQACRDLGGLVETKGAFGCL